MIELKTGWLAPSGDFFECGVYEHMAEATEILRKLLVPYDVILCEDDILIGKGWCKISVSQVGVKEWLIIWQRNLTEPQRAFLRPYFEEESQFRVNVTSTANWERGEW